MAAEFSAAETVPNLLLLEVRHLGVPVLVPDPVDLLLQLLHLQQVRDKPLIPNVRVISKLFRKRLIWHHGNLSHDNLSCYLRWQLVPTTLDPQKTRLHSLGTFSDQLLFREKANHS